MSMSHNALALAHLANRMSDSTDPRQTYVTLMTAAAISGHIISRTPDQMHKTLDDVMSVAESLMTQATETKL
ncbi:MAG TPA: hypothetical protein DIT40_08865 [Alphaproteobacteria bacterium]|nr:hypothetical protein [Alphaproteobacteria bacterium]